MGKYVGERAAAVGGSIAGTLAARVLSESYREVVVVDHDEVLGVSGARRGVPHGLHAHWLHARGYLILKKRFPSLIEDARPTRPADAGLLSITGSRPVLKNYLRSRVEDRLDADLVVDATGRGSRTKDPVVTKALMRITGLVDHTRALWRPSLVAKALWVSRDLWTASRRAPAATSRIAAEAPAQMPVQKPVQQKKADAA